MKAAQEALALLAAAVSGAGGSPAQEPQKGVLEQGITARLLPEVTSRLRSEDPAVVAWGAWLAGRLGTVEAVPALRQRLVRTEAGEPLTLYLLDALVRLDAALPAEDLARFAEGPTLVPVLILAARDVAAHGGLLLDVYRDHAGQGSYPAWRACGNLLAWGRIPEFVEHLLEGLTFTLRVQVVDRLPDAIGMGPGGAGAAVRARSSALDPAYPPLPRYELRFEARPGDVLLAPGPEPVFWRRQEDPQRRWTEVVESDMAWDPSHVEYRWLRLLAGLDTDPAACLVHRSKRIVYTGPQDYAASVAEAVAALQAEHDRLVKALLARGLLTAELAAATTLDLRLQIDDRRTDRSQPLPAHR